MIEIGGLGNCLTDSEEKSAGWSLIEKLSAAENAKKTQKKIEILRSSNKHTNPKLYIIFHGFWDEEFEYRTRFFSKRTHFFIRIYLIFLEIK